MEKKNKAPFIYGYAVCLVSVITFLISSAGFITSVIDMGDPLHAGYIHPDSPSLASFENYKLDVLSGGDIENGFIPEESTLKAMYESAKEERIASASHHTQRQIMVNSMLMVICILLFTSHWIWMLRQKRASSAVNPLNVAV